MPPEASFCAESGVQRRPQGGVDPYQVVLCALEEGLDDAAAAERFGVEAAEVARWRRSFLAGARRGVRPSDH
ncbi:MAG TPA: hypothetical protein DEA08_23465, partial [Planctomycetes bacterium]|nr:hypothetical protein [Planctomycetota bacterium]